MQIITLTTDYGTEDHYAAALKGVILSLAPHVRMVDVTHEIDPQDVLSGAFVLWQAWSWFPVGTIHLAVVDPGVGSERRIVLARYSGSYVVAPDNGLVTFVHRALHLEAMHVVENRRFFLDQVSATFHGRDVMAPVAAHLARGVDPSAIGPPTDRVELLDVPLRAEARDGDLVGRVLHVDRFGTLITNISVDQLRRADREQRVWRVQVDDTDVGPVRRTFSDAAVGETVALIGGGGFLEVAVNRGRAVDRFGRNPVIRVC